MNSENPGMRLAIAIPTYNEVSNIEQVITRLASATQGLSLARCTVLVIDDSSPDGTAMLIERLGKQKWPQPFSVSLLERQTKSGLAAAYSAGFKKLLSENYTHIVQMDADLSHDPSYIPALVAASEQSDMVIGSRYIGGGSTPDWPWYRRALSHGGNLYARLILGGTVHDYTGGYNLFSSRLLQSLDLDAMLTKGYGFQISLKYAAQAVSERIVEIPIVFHDRVHGKSKLPKLTIIESLLLVPRLRITKKQYRRST